MTKKLKPDWNWKKKNHWKDETKKEREDWEPNMRQIWARELVQFRPGYFKVI